MAERVALVSSSFPAQAGDAAGHFVAREAELLASQGYQVSVFAPGRARTSGTNPRVFFLADGGAMGIPGLVARLRERPLRALGLARWLLAMRAALALHGPFDRIVAHFLLPVGFPGLVHLPRGRARLEVVVHGSDARLLARFPRVARRVLSALRADGAHLRCASSELARLLDELGGGLPREMLSVSAPPLDVSGAPSRDQARGELGIAESTRLAVVVARLIPEKRVGEALAAACLVDELCCVVVGDGPERSRLEAQFPGVSFVGQLPRPLTLRWIAAADVLLSASRLEGAPSAIREARALGVPVVSLRAGDLTEWAKADPDLWVVG